MKHLLKRSYIIVIIVIASIATYCGQLRMAARVGNSIITIGDLKTAFTANGQQLQKKYSYTEVTTKLQELIDNRLALIDARRQGLDKDAKFISELEDFRNGRVYMTAINKLVIDKVLPTKLLRSKYQHDSQEIKARHIYIPVKDKAGVSQSIQLLKDLRGKVLRGEDFDALARRFSKDSLSAGKGGDLGFIKWGDRDWGEEFYQQLFRLKPGDVSRVVEGTKGLHLIKVEQIREIPQIPFAKKREDLQRSFYREKGKILDSTFYAQVANMEKKYNLLQSEQAIDSLMVYIQKAKENGINFQLEPLRFLDSLTVEQRRMPLATFKKGPYTIEDAVKTYDRISERRRPVFVKKEAIQEFLQRNLPRKLFISYGYEKGYHLSRAVRKAVADEKNRMMISAARQKGLGEVGPFSEEQTIIFYEQNRHLFESGAQVNVQEILVKDDMTAYLVFRQATAGEDFTRLAKDYNVRSETQNSGGNLGWITESMYDAVGQKATKMNIGEISEPINHNEGFSIIKILDRKSGELPDLKKNISRVRREMRNKMTTDRKKQWLDGIKASIPVMVYEPVLRKEFKFDQAE